jgi:hypothetical protein
VPYGSQDSQVVFPSWTGGLDFLRSTQSDCNAVQFNSCTNAQINPLAGATANTDTAATLTSDASYWLWYRTSSCTHTEIASERAIGGANRQSRAASSVAESSSG